MEAHRPPLPCELSPAKENDHRRNGKDLEMRCDLGRFMGIQIDLFHKREMGIERFSELGSQGMAYIAVLSAEVKQHARLFPDGALKGFEGHVAP